MVKVGFFKNDITPRVGVELSGFGPFICRKSEFIRDRLWARAMAVERGGKRMVLVTCDLVGVSLSLTQRTRAIVANHTDLPAEALMICCSHTHSGPTTALNLGGWGVPDPPYCEALPARIARAALGALENLTQVELSHAEVPCVGVGLNREYDKDAPPLEDVLRDDWRPARPELTDTTCHVITARANGQVKGFVSYFGCHPVTCCSATRYIHGDYAGVATNVLEREHPGSVGLFIQGANGDVNSCVVHKPQQEALLALDVVAGRYARAVRTGIGQGRAMDVDSISYRTEAVTFSRKDIGLETLRAMAAEKDAVFEALDVSDESRETRMEMVRLIGLRNLIAQAEAGESLEPATEIAGMRLGPVTILGSGFETFQAIKNDVRNKARGPVTLVASLTNDSVGYAPDRAVAERGGYAADQVPLMYSQLPYADIHDELTAALLKVDAGL